MKTGSDTPSPEGRITKICAKCGKEFTCVVGEGCWCEEVYVSRENLARIRRDYLDCLCPNCLKAYGPSEN